MRLVYKGQITPGKQERNKIRPRQACEATGGWDVAGVCGYSCLSNCNSWTWFHMNLTKKIEFLPCWEALGGGKDNFRMSNIFVSQILFSLCICCIFFKKEKIRDINKNSRYSIMWDTDLWLWRQAVSAAHYLTFNMSQSTCDMSEPRTHTWKLGTRVKPRSMQQWMNSGQEYYPMLS